jgi:hypothetical protein
VDRFSTFAIRSSLVWLLLGIAAGAAMLNDDQLPGRWRLWMSPTHAHMLFVGWFFQFTLGVAYWLLPRRRSPARPVGYHEPLALAALVLLNVGLALRVVAEPAQRSGRDGDWIQIVLALSSAGQLIAFGIAAAQIWPRVAARAPRPTSASPVRPSPPGNPPEGGPS